MTRNYKRYPKRPLRRSQIITTFGVGAIVDFRGPESMMTAGIDVWPDANEAPARVPEVLVREPRLEARLQKSHFRLPPAFDPDARFPDTIPFVRFPVWHYCPDCELMSQLNYYQLRVHCEKPECEKRKKYLLPVRIIAVCPSGHAEDFPFQQWVHDGQVPDGKKHRLSWKAHGESASLAGILIECNCGSRKTLAGAFNYSEASGSALSALGIKCHARRPWLGDNGTQGSCQEHLRVVQRGATNTYFAAIKSSIYLPVRSTNVDPQLDSEATKIVDNFADEDQASIDTAVMYSARMNGLDKQELAKLVNEKLDERNRLDNLRDQSEEQFRADEYRVLTGKELMPGEELRMKESSIAEYGDLEQYFKRIRCISKLRETRVLTGFTRLQPPDEGRSTREQDLSRHNLPWLPAMVVNGEGIFIEFRSDTINKWHSGPIQERVRNMRQEYASRIPQVDFRVNKFVPKFVLLHTFAHLLIRELSFECGYGTAALRERIYCDISEDFPMNGVLVYTASGDSEGTLGGLVRQGKPDRLSRTVRSALLKSIWCTADPVCIESKGQGINNSNLAAVLSIILCH